MIWNKDFEGLGFVFVDELGFCDENNVYNLIDS